MSVLLSTLLPAWKGGLALHHMLSRTTAKQEGCSHHCTPVSTLTRSRRDHFSACPFTPAAVTARPPTLPGSKGALGSSPRAEACQHGAGAKGRPFWQVLLRTDRDEATLCSFCWGRLRI